MSTLRAPIIEDVQACGLAAGTIQNYIHHIKNYAEYFGKSPDTLDLEAVRLYSQYLLQERKFSPESVNHFICAAKLLYRITLEMPWGHESFARPRRRHKLPVVLNYGELIRLFDFVTSIKYRAILMLCPVPDCASAKRSPSRPRNRPSCFVLPVNLRPSLPCVPFRRHR